MIGRVHFFPAGTSESWQALALRGGEKKRMLFPAVVAAVEHSTKGVVLFDTGLAPRVYEVTRSFPERACTLAARIRTSPEETALAQLKLLGIRSDDVRFVLCSHFHPDHIGGAADFTRARYIYSAEGYEELRQRTRWGRVRAGFLARLLPQDFEQRALALGRDQLRTQVSDLRDFHAGFDLFGDGSMVIVELPGHAVGQLGAVVRENSRKDYLLAGDACWLTESYQRDIPPPGLVMNLLFDDRKAYLTTLRRIHEFSKAYPDFRIVPGHCPKSLRELAG